MNTTPAATGSLRGGRHGRLRRPASPRTSLARQIVWFFVLSFVLSWICFVPAIFVEPPLRQVFLGIGSTGPALAAIWLTARTGQQGAVRGLLSGLLRWRTSPWWYLMALAAPFLLIFGAAALSDLLGGPPLSLNPDLVPAGVPWYIVIGTGLLPSFLYSLFTGSALGEEIGWRGYALPRLQKDHTALNASLILGVVWSLWHLPLFFGPPLFSTISPAALFVILSVTRVASCLLFTWIYNNTRGSLLMAVLLHAAFNFALMIPFGAHTSAGPLLLVPAIACVTAGIVLALFGSTHLSRNNVRVSI